MEGFGAKAAKRAGAWGAILRKCGGQAKILRERKGGMGTGNRSRRPGANFMLPIEPFVPERPPLWDISNGDTLDQTRAKERILDSYLVAAVRLGDRRAFELLVGRWNGRLLAHARRLLGDDDTARDAVQEAWAEIVRGIARLKDERAFPAWAYRIVSRRCARLIGHTQRQRKLEKAILAAPEGQPDHVPPHTDIEKLRAAIRELPPGQRAAVALFHLEDLSIAEVAVALDVPAGTVKTRLMHARQKLRATLEGERQ